jgi:hypothetical protein
MIDDARTEEGIIKVDLRGAQIVGDWIMRRRRGTVNRSTKQSLLAWQIKF